MGKSGEVNNLLSRSTAMTTMTIGIARAETQDDIVFMSETPWIQKIG